MVMREDCNQLQVTFKPINRVKRKLTFASAGYLLKEI